ncbi:TonB-dependent receptor [Sphingomonas sp.]|uniref:TonB-dependent receptor n=1 Tax=Sphingomonas sp. TaxID=28214 RepID=UPI002C12C70D|nr:TonB-dependent receptor [Sphingomonas sp.]HTG39020.1 TonB-dependent receptor [Sphingomonas sp.]
MMKTALFISSAGLALAATPAAAQEAPVDQDASPERGSPAPAVRAGRATAGDDIIVTAQKREQSLIEVPQSVSVVTGAMLEAQAVNNIADYLNNVPALQLVQSTPGEGRLVLRGVNTGGVASTVSVYLDETPFGSSSGLANGAALAGDFDTFDIARVEVLRGPQGTLYGASSLGGLVKYVTNAPDPTAFEARARGAVEFTEGGDPSYQGNALINVPLGSTLAVRASGTYRRQGGFIDSVGIAGSDVHYDINDYRTYGGRASVLWTPSDALEIRASALLQNIEVDAPTRVETDPFTLDPLYGGLTQSQYVPAYSNVEYRLYNLLIDYDLGFGSLTSSTSRSVQRQRRRDDQTVFINNVIDLFAPAFGLPALDNADAMLRQTTSNRKWTQELRLAGAPGGTIEWLVGGYYTHEEALIDQVIDAVDAGTLNVRPYLTEIGGLGGATTASTYEEYAGFANATIHLGSRFDLDLGGRYSHNDQTSLNTGFGLLGATETYAGQSSDDVFTYSIAPKLRFSDNANVYARVAKGYRPGGPNVVPPGAPADFPVTFAPDEVTSYEIGFKGETANGTFGLEAALYHIDWSDIQLLAVVEGFGANVNGASADIDGAEFTATIRPVRGFVTTINGAYNRAVLAEDTDPQLLGAVRGDALPFTPRYTVGINSDYQWALGGDVEASVGGSIRSVSGQTGNYDATYLAAYDRFPRIPAYETIDLRASLDFDRFILQAYVRNVTDARGITAVIAPIASGVANYPGGAAAVGVTRPRTVGLSLTAGF